jgi:hypothetical protein
MRDLVLFLDGAFACCLAGIALFFLRYWRTTGDRLFLWFSASFWIQAANRVAIAFLATDEARTSMYWIRLAAYALIVLAIIDKNRARSGGSDRDGA